MFLVCVLAMVPLVPNMQEKTLIYWLRVLQGLMGQYSAVCFDVPLMFYGLLYVFHEVGLRPVPSLVSYEFLRWVI